MQGETKGTEGTSRGRMTKEQGTSLGVSMHIPLTHQACTNCTFSSLLSIQFVLIKSTWQWYTGALLCCLFLSFDAI